jgi:ribosomal protein S18 acetylase RimI-like enzyme
VHYDFDNARFMQPGPGAEEGYAWFLGSQLENPESLVLVAEREGAVVGYLCASIEPRNWKELRERAGFVHDILVTDESRGLGAAQALMDEAFTWMRQQNVPRVLLWTAAPNDRARRLFERLGFRPTMVEMTRELE